MKRFNSRLFIVLSILFAVIAFFSFRAAFSRDEGTLVVSKFNIFFANLFNIMRFPILVLFPNVTKPPLFFSIGLIANCTLYSLVIERIVFYIFVKRYIKEE